MDVSRHRRCSDALQQGDSNRTPFAFLPYVLMRHKWIISASKKIFPLQLKGLRVLTILHSSALWISDWSHLPFIFIPPCRFSHIVVPLSSYRYAKVRHAAAIGRNMINVIRQVAIRDSFHYFCTRWNFVHDANTKYACEVRLLLLSTWGCHPYIRHCPICEAQWAWFFKRRGLAWWLTCESEDGSIELAGCLLADLLPKLCVEWHCLGKYSWK